MTLRDEITVLKQSLKQGLELRSSARVVNGQNQSPLWPLHLYLFVAIVLITALALIPFDGTLSREAVAANNFPLTILRKTTNLVLAAPYIGLFFMGILLALAGRKRLRKDTRFTLRVRDFMRSYDDLGRIAAHCLFGITAILAAGTVVNIIKYIVGRPRPFLIDSVGPFGFKPFDYSHAFVSFPSGHATTAAVLATLLALWLPRYRIAAYLILALIASARIFVQAHYPTDVLLGFAIGTIVTVILARFFAQCGLLFEIHPRRLMPVIMVYCPVRA